ncbi:hypothetical protein TRFO_28736 [Tritrichomonas foetus]|uniref:Trichohyalin n=1 Tax=Tritrichomonas foetus TaxID=1144522 RepID=A0A1J4JXL5_9EUKA|nr:hypothetical protein TRFO_28736 [Tritrichomonas foetus]|eukprot:OHT03895.1 hypothetical protein TRFO_28736 [Tritrichomonas foetus]
MKMLLNKKNTTNQIDIANILREKNNEIETLINKISDQKEQVLSSESNIANRKRKLISSIVHDYRPESEDDAIELFGIISESTEVEIPYSTDGEPLSGYNVCYSNDVTNINDKENANDITTTSICHTESEEIRKNDREEQERREREEEIRKEKEKEMKILEKERQRKQEEEENEQKKKEREELLKKEEEERLKREAEEKRKKEEEERLKREKDEQKKKEKEEEEKKQKELDEIRKIQVEEEEKRKREIEDLKRKLAEEERRRETEIDELKKKLAEEAEKRRTEEEERKKREESERIKREEEEKKKKVEEELNKQREKEEEERKQKEELLNEMKEIQLEMRLKDMREEQERREIEEEKKAELEEKRKAQKAAEKERKRLEEEEKRKELEKQERIQKEKEEKERNEKEEKDKIERKKREKEEKEKREKEIIDRLEKERLEREEREHLEREREEAEEEMKIKDMREEQERREIEEERRTEIEEKKRQEEERKRKEEEEKRRKSEEEAEKRRLEEEAEKRRLEEEERRRLEEEERKRKEEEERKRLEEEEKRKKEEERRKREEKESNRKKKIMKHFSYSPAVPLSISEFPLVDTFISDPVIIQEDPFFSETEKIVRNDLDNDNRNRNNEKEAILKRLLNDFNAKKDEKNLLLQEIDGISYSEPIDVPDGYKESNSFHDELLQTKKTNEKINILVDTLNSCRGDAKKMRKIEQKIENIQAEILETDKTIGETTEKSYDCDRQIAEAKEALEDAKSDRNLALSVKRNTKLSKDVRDAEYRKRQLELSQILLTSHDMEKKLEELQRRRGIIDKDIFDIDHREKPEVVRLSADVATIKEKVHDEKDQLNKSRSDISLKRQQLDDLRNSERRNQYYELFVQKSKIERRIMKWKMMLKDSKESMHALEAFSSINYQRKKGLSEALQKLEREKFKKMDMVEDMKLYSNVLSELINISNKVSST